MAKQTINIGTVANDGTGDSVRTGGDKINDNFNEIYTAFGDGSSLNDIVTDTTFQSTLANTNSYIGAVETREAAHTANTLAQLANTNLAISDRLQVANAAVYLQVANSTTFLNKTSEVAHSVTANVAIDSTSATSGVHISNGAIEVYSATGSPSYIDFYCEVSNAHRTRVQSAAHSDYAGNVTLTLPVNTGTLVGTASNNDFTSTNQMRLGAPVKTTTANAYTLAIADAGFYHRLNYANTSESGSTTVGITIPANSTTAIPIGSEYLFVRTGSNSAFQFANAAGVVVNSDGGKLRVRYQWQSAVCKKVATDEWDIIGNLSS
jgi:hypothetical protein